MLIGLLLAYLFLGGSNQTFLLNPNLRKNVSEYVTDKDRRTQIDQILKQVAKSEENFQKETKKNFGKKLEELNMDRASTESQFNAEYTKFYDSLKGLQES